VDGAMPVDDINHVLVRTTDIEATRDFYVDVLGFDVLPRPNFPFPGYWLGVQGTALVHVALHGVENSELYYIGSPADAPTNNAGVIDHVAFVATDPQNMIERFERLGIEFRPRFLPESELYQLFVADPNGVMIELNFFGVTDISSWSDGKVENYSAMPRTVETP
jgi:catechol 2,3-dioxygenase-like lactoylglutathione lyase family enzyme